MEQNCSQRFFNARLISRNTFIIDIAGSTKKEASYTGLNISLYYLNIRAYPSDSDSWGGESINSIVTNMIMAIEKVRTSLSIAQT